MLAAGCWLLALIDRVIANASLDGRRAPRSQPRQNHHRVQQPSRISSSEAQLTLALLPAFYQSYNFSREVFKFRVVLNVLKVLAAITGKFIIV